MNGIIYCRVSSKEQIEGTSLESQESACRDYARSHRIEILKVFVERGESAKFADRTQLIELINYCRDNKGRVDVLLVWKVDRFARNVTDHFGVKAGLGKYGVKVLSVTESIGANPEGNLMETILAGFAQFDNDVRATRTTQGMRKRIQEGILPRRPPLGYRHSSKNHIKKTEPDEPDEPTFSILQRVWKMFVTGAYTKAEICSVARRLGLRTRNGISLPRQSLDHIFANKFYAGIIVDSGSGEEYQGKHIPMITLEEFVRVQSVISKKRHAQPHRREREEFPLRGTVRCPECHSYLTGGISRGNGGRYSYYHCYKKNCLRRESYSPADVHGEFQKFLDQLAPTRQLISKVGDLIVELAREANGPQAKQRARDEAALRQVKTQLQELFRLKLDGLITDDEFGAQKSSLVSRRSTLEAAIVDLVLDENSIRSKLTEITDPLISLSKTWDALPIQLKRRFKQFLLGFGYLHRSIRTAETPILFKLFHPLPTSNARLVAPASASWNQIVQEIEEFAELIREWRAEKTAA